MDRVLLDEVINTDYGQFDLVWDDDSIGFDGDFERFFDGQVNGLVGAADPGGVYLNLARRSGGSPVRIVLCESEPSADESYQDAVEVSVTIPPGASVGWSSWAGENHGVLEGIADGPYRLRVSARDRDRGREGEFEEGPTDAYLVQLWPAPASADAIVRVGSEDAEYWHGQNGGKR